MHRCTAAGSASTDHCRQGDACQPLIGWTSTGCTLTCTMAAWLECWWLLLSSAARRRSTSCMQQQETQSECEFCTAGALHLRLGGIVSVNAAGAYNAASVCVTDANSMRHAMPMRLLPPVTFTYLLVPIHIRVAVQGGHPLFSLGQCQPLLDTLLHRQQVGAVSVSQKPAGYTSACFVIQQHWARAWAQDAFAFVAGYGYSQTSSSRPHGTHLMGHCLLSEHLPLLLSK